MSTNLSLEERLIEQDLCDEFELTKPTNINELYQALQLITGEIEPGERIQVTVPRKYSHDVNGEHDLEIIERIQSFIRGEDLGSNIIVALRFGKYPFTDVIVDICGVEEIPKVVPKSLIPTASVSAAVAPMPPVQISPVQMQARQLTPELILELERGLLIHQDIRNRYRFQVLGKITNIGAPDLNALIPLTDDDIQFAMANGLVHVHPQAMPQIGNVPPFSIPVSSINTLILSPPTQIPGLPLQAPTQSNFPSL